jgi:hypothetical protein
MSNYKMCDGSKLDHKKTKVGGEFVYRGYTLTKDRILGYTTKEDKSLFAHREVSLLLTINARLDA